MTGDTTTDGDAPLVRRERTPEVNVTQCPVRAATDPSGLTVVALNPVESLTDYRVAMALAASEASARIGEHMLLSWYDRDRDFESPQHAIECHENSAIKGYEDYGLNHGASLKVDVEGGRFVFFYLPASLPESILIAPG
ncbi:MAG: AF1514 family protein [Acidiferrobacterales bacterium]